MHVHMILRLLTTAALAGLLMVAGCRIQPGTTPASKQQPIVTALGPHDALPSTLQHLASIEKRSRTLQPMDVPAPPGVEPELLKERRVGRVLSQINVDEALALILKIDDDGAATPDDEAAQQIAVAPADADQALREYAIGRDDALQRRHLSAVTHFIKALEMTPGDVAVLREMARSYLALGNRTKALQTYEQILEHEPRHSEAAFMAALAAADQRDFTTAAQLLGRKITRGESFEHDPGADALAEYVLGVSLGHLGYDEASIEMTRRVLARLDSTPVSSMYSARLGSVFRQRGELWRSIGDAYCRQGKYEEALQTYDRSAELPMPDPFALAPRVLYANLRLGQVHHAQLELYAALRMEAPHVSERLIGLCMYMREYGGSLNALAREIVELQKQYPKDPTLVRTAAALLNDRDATNLLRDYVAQQPDNVEVIGELLRWLAASNVQSAVEFTVGILTQQSQLTNAVVQQLFHAVDRPSDAIAAARSLPATPEAAVVEGRLLMMTGGLGPAWSTLETAAARWPEHTPLQHSRMELAASLEEPSLLLDVIDSWPGEPDVTTLLAQSRALRRAGLGEKAVAAAERAVLHSGESAEALTELAWAHLSFGVQLEITDRAQLHGQDAAQYAEQAISKDATHEQAYHVLTAVYGPGGPLADPAKLRDAARRLFNENPDSRLYQQLVAEESLSRRRYEQALEQALNLYETQPSDTASLKMAVSAWRNMNRLEDAARWLKQKLNDRPGDPHLMEQWATVQLIMNRAETALTYLEQEVDADPLNYAALRLLESTYQAAGRLDRAVELGEQRLLGRPAGIRRELELASLYGGTQRETQSLQRLELVLQQADVATRPQLVAAVSLAARVDESVAGRNDLVVALSEATAQRFDQLPLELYRPGLLVLAGRQADSGVFKAFAERVALDVRKRGDDEQQEALQWQRLAQQLVDAGHPQAAAEAAMARVLVQRGFEDEGAHSVLCLAAFSAQAAVGGQAENSIAFMRELRQRNRLPLWPAINGTPDLVQSLYELSQMYHILGDEDGAAVILRELIGIQPQHAMALNNLGYMLIERGDSDERTIRMIELAASLDPNEPNILDTIGWLRYKQGKFDNAVNDAANDVDDAAVNVVEENADAAVSVAEQRAADVAVVEGALSYIQKANDIDTSPSPEALDHLGDVHWRLGQEREAVNSWNRVIDLLSDRREIRQTIEMYERVQQQLWWLVVVDAEAIYDRNWGMILERTQQKLDAVKAGTPPAVAPTFAELRSDAGSEHIE